MWAQEEQGQIGLEARGQGLSCGLAVAEICLLCSAWTGYNRVKWRKWHLHQKQWNNDQDSKRRWLQTPTLTRAKNKVKEVRSDEKGEESGPLFLAVTSGFEESLERWGHSWKSLLKKEPGLRSHLLLYEQTSFLQVTIHIHQIYFPDYYSSDRLKIT